MSPKAIAVSTAMLKLIEPMCLFNQFTNPKSTWSPLWKPELDDWGLWPDPRNNQGKTIKFRRYG